MAKKSEMSATQDNMLYAIAIGTKIALSKNSCYVNDKVSSRNRLQRITTEALERMGYVVEVSTEKNDWSEVRRIMALTDKGREYARRKNYPISTK